MGKVEIIQNENDSATITLDANTANISAGKSGKEGDIILKGSNGRTNVQLGTYVVGKDNNIVTLSGIKVFAPNDQEIIKLLTSNKLGYFAVDDGSGDPSLEFMGEKGTLSIGSHINNGKVIVKDGKLREIIKLDGTGGGVITVRNSQQKEIIRFDSTGGESLGHDEILIRDPLNRRVLAFDNNSFDGRTAGLFIGAHTSDGGGKPGIIALRDHKGKDSIFLDGPNGDVYVKDDAGRNAFAFISDAFDANIAGLWIGASRDELGGKPGIIALRDQNGTDSIFIDGVKGDIVLNNADCAEEFDVSESASTEPGDVLVIDKEGTLRKSTEAYDKKVAGVISGADGLNPAIILNKKHLRPNRMPVAMFGKVSCKVDANYAEIELGDMLTTSPTPGYAMKAIDTSKAFGSVIGKALRGLKSGKSLIPILMALQ
jgi:hypothetical protein